MGIDTRITLRTKASFDLEAINLRLRDAFDSHGNELPMRLAYYTDFYESEGWPLEPGEIVLELRNCHWRFYGEGYERGPLPSILALCKWLETVIPGSTIYYWNDHSEPDYDSPFTTEAQQKIWKYFCEVGHYPYYYARRGVK